MTLRLLAGMVGNSGSAWLVLKVCVLYALTLHVAVSIPSDYARLRQALIQAETALQIGGNGSSLSPDEQRVNRVLLADKSKIMEAGRLNGSYFPAGVDFLTSRAAMETTTSFTIIRRMPKGEAKDVPLCYIVPGAWP